MFIQISKQGEFNIRQDEKNIILTRVWITDGDIEDTIKVESEIMEIVPKTKFSDNQCKYAEKWNLSLDKNGHIPFLDLSQCKY